MHVTLLTNAPLPFLFFVFNINLKYRLTSVHCATILKYLLPPPLGDGLGDTGDGVGGTVSYTVTVAVAVARFPIKRKFYHFIVQHYCSAA